MPLNVHVYHRHCICAYACSLFSGTTSLQKLFYGKQFNSWDMYIKVIAMANEGVSFSHMTYLTVKSITPDLKHQHKQF